MTTVAEDFYGRLGPLVVEDPENGYAARDLADALTWPLRLVYALSTATETLDPWEVALNPDLAPEEILPWLAQIPGVRLRPGDTVEQQRVRIRAAAGLYAGTDQSIRDEVAPTLTSKDPGMVRVVHPSRWAITVITRTADTPDLSVSESAALAQVPAGSILTFVVSDVPYIDEGTELIDNVTATIDAATLADVT